MTMPTSWFTAAALALLGASASAAPSLQAATVGDPTGFDQPVPAATLQIPADWRTQGGVVWNHATSCSTNKVRFEWRSRSRDDLEGFELMPGYGWQLRGAAIQTNPCPVQPFRSAQEFLTAVVQARRAGARILQYRDRPDVVARREQQPHTGQGRRRFDAGQVLVAYESGGVEFREVIGTSVLFTQLGNSVMGGVDVVYALRAPAGRLDFDLADQLERSFRFNPEWLRAMNGAVANAERRFSGAQRQAIDSWHAREMARINAEGAADRAAIRAAASRDVAAIRSATAANTAATNDNIHRRTLEGIGEYNTYRTPDGGTARSSIHGGNRVLQGAGGAVFSTDDPYFNPAGSRELQRVR
ncbi:hypothetical protein [Piscinibacter koreensis]|uniref:Uncharacterized protein n=1 Tax=Piscinibacter koreensis TaxID=2742824 RepID=A0A7Y6TYD8_9BURK|nr:hypothetical protein [Schlegelella koreensis]NUZ08104.1 hypothetical protein [Schlegelella koreensis]